MMFSHPTMRMRTCLAIFSLVFAVSGCTLLARKSGEQTANDAGALILISQTAFADPLSRQGRRKLADAEKQALNFGRAGQPVGWEGRRGRTGTVTAFQPFRVGKAMCRRFEHTLNLANGPQTAAATACRRGDGPWKLVK